MTNPFEIRETLISEILSTFREYFKNADEFVINYPDYSCRQHSDIKKFVLERIPDTFVNGYGIKLDNEWTYKLYTPILWKLKCECGYEIDVGFLIHYATNEWEEIKQKLLSEPLSKDNMVCRQLSEYSHYEFFDGIFSFEKKLKL